jgi:hypothetical protein
MQKSGELIAVIFDDDLQTSDTETSIELNFAVLKFKHTIKKEKTLSTRFALDTQHRESLEPCRRAVYRILN